jgi:SNF2 family DNA or RNA helicase
VIQRIYAEAESRMPGAFLIYDGSVKPSERQNIIDRFQEDEKVRAIIISLAGATGITLTAAARMRVVEPDWTPSNMIQIEDRIWRIGQERNVDIGYLSVAGTLDARIGTALVEKMESDEKAINTIQFKHQDVKAEAADPKPLDNNNVDEQRGSGQPELPF